MSCCPYCSAKLNSWRLIKASGLSGFKTYACPQCGEKSIVTYPLFLVIGIPLLAVALGNFLRAYSWSITFAALIAFCILIGSLQFKFARLGKLDS
jgi:hypothetical protein